MQKLILFWDFHITFRSEHSENIADVESKPAQEIIKYVEMHRFSVLMTSLTRQLR